MIDADEILNVAKQYAISGLMTMQTDLPVPSIGRINDALHLTGVSFKTSENCSNKIKTRKCFASRNVRQPEFSIVSSPDEAKIAADKIGYPCVIKSADSSGSRGVTKVNHHNDINSAFLEALKHTRQKDILVEEYIKGTEIGAQVFSVNGKCVKVLLHNDTLSPPPFMIPIGHSFPIKMNKKDALAVEQNIKTAVEALGIENGPSNIDLIIDKDKKDYIIEVGARIGATCLPELVEYYTGINWVEQSINNAIGLDVNLECKTHDPIAALIIESNKDGIFKNHSIPDEVQHHRCVKEIEITAKVGDQVSLLRKGTDRIGKIIVSGKDVVEAEKSAKYLRDKININVGD